MSRRRVQLKDAGKETKKEENEEEKMKANEMKLDKVEKNERGKRRYENNETRMETQGDQTNIIAIRREIKQGNNFFLYYLYIVKKNL